MFVRILQLVNILLSVKPEKYNCYSIVSCHIEHLGAEYNSPCHEIFQSLSIEMRTRPVFLKKLADFLV